MAKPKTLPPKNEKAHSNEFEVYLAIMIMMKKCTFQWTFLHLAKTMMTINLSSKTSSNMD